MIRARAAVAAGANTTMGYAYSAYTVDLAKLASVFGSQDTKLLAAVLKKQARAIREHDESFEDDDDDDNKSFGTVTQGCVIKQSIQEVSNGY